MAARTAGEATDLRHLDALTLPIFNAELVGEQVRRMSRELLRRLHA